MLKNFCYIIILLSFACSFITYFKHSELKSIKFFVIYLFFTVLTEMIVFYISLKGYNTNEVYNVFGLIEFNLLFLFYNQVSKNNITRKAIVFAVIFFNVFSFFNYWYIDFNFSLYNTIVVVIGGFLIALILFLYLREILVSEEIINYKKNIIFWITTGLLLYYLGSIPLMTAHRFLEKGIVFSQLYTIQYVITIMLHSCVIIGIIWGLKRVS